MKKIIIILLTILIMVCLQADTICAKYETRWVFCGATGLGLRCPFRVCAAWVVITDSMKYY